MVQLISVLRKCGLKARLKAAREAMRERFPLPEAAWLEWLQDEISEAAGPSARPGAHEGVKALFELAVQDYLSIEIWVQYLQ
jgi:squamous cell carcinoma antigen recognized by T-cells 3